MFYKYVSRKWKSGEVSVGLPAKGYGDTPCFEGRGIVGIAIRWLSQEERAALVELARREAISKRDAGHRSKVKRSLLADRLACYAFIEIAQALEILSESNTQYLSLEDVRRVWDRVSNALDHHDCDMLPDLLYLENDLAKAGRFGDSQD